MKIAADFQRTLATGETLGTMTADATRPRRLLVHDMIFGSEANTADAALLWRVFRVTSAGTNTAVTLGYIDPADSSSEYDAGEAHSSEPTGSAVTSAYLMQVPLNQRATFRWVAAPGMELVMPQTPSAGFGIRTPVCSTGTPIITATVHALEM